MLFHAHRSAFLQIVRTRPRMIIAILILVLLAACAGPGPYRHASAKYLDPVLAGSCAKIYARTDAAIRKASADFSLTYGQRNERLDDIRGLIRGSWKRLPACWQTAYEKHDSYDLFYVEFDDAGQATDHVEDGTPYDQTQLYYVEKFILDALDHKQSLNIIVFTHGWHGTARADDDYSMEFKGILEDAAFREEKYATSPSIAAQIKAHHLTRHKTVGIEVAWRGDSWLAPSVANVWDRKLAAETVSIGAVHELFAFLNQVYLDNSCHGKENITAAQLPCDRVHLLTVGHSFGGLINFRSLVSRLQSGLNVDQCHRAYGFGDMTVLLNPAMEAARYRPLFLQAIDRPMLRGPYFGKAGKRSNCPTEAGTADEPQIPTIVTLQSEGDTATGFWFPLFRRATTPFAQTLSSEEVMDKNRAVGWQPDFETEQLVIPTSYSAADECKGFQSQYCPFQSGRSVQADPSQESAASHKQRMLLTWDPKATFPLPAYMPLWSVMVSKQIMVNHDDFWNPHIVRLISLLFEDAYEQTDRIPAAALR